MGPSTSDNTYIIEESEADLARLIEMDTLYTRYAGGVFPERQGFLHSERRVLDLACGPGGWALQVASGHPGLEVTGVDINQRVIDYARSRARGRGLSNAGFERMDITGPLAFPSQTFDLVNARFVHTVLLQEDWLPFLRECQRVLRPGGIVRLTEAEVAVSNMPASNQLLSLLPRTFKQNGRGFSPDGSSMGITYMLGHFLRQAGFVETRERAFTVNFSVGTDAQSGYTQHLRIVFSAHLLGAYLIKEGLMSANEYQTLYENALEEMVSDEFCGISFLLTVVAEKPFS